MEDTLNSYGLVKDGASSDEMKNYIYTFIKYYYTLKNDLFNKHKRIFTQRMKNSQRLDMLNKFILMSIMLSYSKIHVYITLLYKNLM